MKPTSYTQDEGRQPDNLPPDPSENSFQVAAGDEAVDAESDSDTDSDKTIAERLVNAGIEEADLDQRHSDEVR